MTRSRIGALTIVSALMMSGRVLSRATGPESPATTLQSPSASPQSLIDVLHYDAAIEPDLEARSIKGRVTIDFVLRASGLGSVEFDSAALVVDAVTEGGAPLVFGQAQRKTRISLRTASAAQERHRITISYHGTPGRPVQFSSEPPFVATIFTTSEWLVCIDAPGDKATLRLTLTTPRESVAASGKEVSRVLRGGRLVTEWREDRPMPTYTFGFAAGRFTEWMRTENGVQLVMLGAGFSPDQLAKLAADTADAIRFFADRSGVSYAGLRYTQVVAGTGVGQEMSRFSLLPASYGQAVLADGGTTSLGVHELAHQWWGNLVTCANWTDFWLNEGVATFMTAAYTEQRLGRAAYQTQIQDSRSRYERVRDAGHDRPLQFHDWNRPTADDRTIVYHKGAYVLSRLRDKLGDEPFWRGVRGYTQAHAGKSVSSLDLERAMEQASGLDLSEFFAEWVFGS